MKIHFDETIIKNDYKIEGTEGRGEIEPLGAR